MSGCDLTRNIVKLFSVVTPQAWWTSLRTKFKGTRVGQSRRVVKSKRGSKRLGTWTLGPPRSPLRGRRGEVCSVDLSPTLLHWFSVPVQTGLPVSPTAWVTAMSPCHRASLSRWGSLEWEEPDSARAAQRSVLTVRTVRITNCYGPTLDRTSSDDLAPTQSSQRMPFFFLFGMEGLSHKAHSCKDL